ncbi:MAG: hypothetical protein ACPGVK_00915 [Halocynthiibacter sp.]
MGNDSFLTRQELDAALPHILNAPKDHAMVKWLCYRETYGARAFRDVISLTPQDGILGERWGKAPWLKRSDGSPDPRIQVCILPERILDLVWQDRENIPHPGDTFVADLDMTEANLPVGQRLKIGDVVLEVSDVFNDACVKWKARYGAASRGWINDPAYCQLRLRGVLCQIIEGGDLRLGEKIVKL